MASVSVKKVDVKTVFFKLQLNFLIYRLVYLVFELRSTENFFLKSYAVQNIGITNLRSS